MRQKYAFKAHSHKLFLEYFITTNDFKVFNSFLKFVYEVFHNKDNRHKYLNLKRYLNIETISQRNNLKYFHISNLYSLIEKHTNYSEIYLLKIQYMQKVR